MDAEEIEPQKNDLREPAAETPAPAAEAQVQPSSLEPARAAAGEAQAEPGQTASRRPEAPTPDAVEPTTPTPPAAVQAPAQAIPAAGPVLTESSPTQSAPTTVPIAPLEPVHPVGGTPEGPILTDAEAERRIRAMSRKSFLWAAAAVGGSVASILWLGSRRLEKNIPWPFRRVLEVNENLSRDMFSSARLAPEFPKAAAQMPRANGAYGVADEVDPDWNLRLVGLADMSAAEVPDPAEPEPASSEPSDGDNAAPTAPDDKKGGDGDKKGGSEQAAVPSGQTKMEAAVLVTLEQIKTLPRTEIITELKCIEGWSTVVHWAGVRLSDFMHKYPPATKSGDPFDPARVADLPEYVSMETPDGAYFVGLDMASALHPQTLLCYEMNGKPLTAEHGAPLRLAIPVKYGIKNIKNIGKIKFTDVRPEDYWANLGYDWYAGH